MSLCHYAIGHISRGSGRTSVQSAAYITGFFKPIRRSPSLKENRSFPDLDRDAFQRSLDLHTHVHDLLTQRLSAPRRLGCPYRPLYHSSPSSLTYWLAPRHREALALSL